MGYTPKPASAAALVICLGYVNLPTLAGSPLAPVPGTGCNLIGTAFTLNTSTGFTLLSSDVGNVIMVMGAGVGGAPLWTTIQAVGSSSTATLVDSAISNVALVQAVIYRPLNQYNSFFNGSYVLMGSIHYDSSLTVKTSFQFKTFSPTGAFRPVPGQPVLAYIGTIGTYIGLYNPSTPYALNNVVTYYGQRFISLANGNTGNTPPLGTSNAYWATLDVFGGMIQQAKPTNLQKSTALESECECVAWDILLTRAVISLRSGTATSSYADSFDGDGSTQSFDLTHTPVSITDANYRTFGTVTVSGGSTAVAWFAGGDFAGLGSGTIEINGLNYTIATVIDNYNLTVTTPIPVGTPSQVPWFGPPTDITYEFGTAPNSVWLWGPTTNKIVQSVSIPPLTSSQVLNITYNYITVSFFDQAYAGDIFTALLALLNNAIAYRNDGVTVYKIQGPLIQQIEFTPTDTIDTALSALCQYISDGSTNYWYYTDARRGVHFEIQSVTRTAPWQINVSSLDPLGYNSDGNVLLEVSNTQTTEKMANTALVTTSNALGSENVYNYSPQGYWNGVKRTFNVSYPVGQILAIEEFRFGEGSIIVPMSEIAIAGSTTTGAHWYWTPGSTLITQDSSQPVLAVNDALGVTYLPIVSSQQQYANEAAVFARQAIEGGSGEYDVSQQPSTGTAPILETEDISQVIAEYFSQLSESLEVQTYRYGLVSGQGITINLPGIAGPGTFVVDSIQMVDQDNLLRWTVTCIRGAAIGDWKTAFKKLTGAEGITTIGGGGGQGTTLSLLGITPSSGLPGTTVNVTLTGTGFTANSVVVTDNANVIVDGSPAVTVLSSTEITATLTILAGASGVANVSVIVGDQTTSTVTFTVIALAPAPFPLNAGFELPIYNDPLFSAERAGIVPLLGTAQDGTPLSQIAVYGNPPINAVSKIIAAPGLVSVVVSVTGGTIVGGRTLLIGVNAFDGPSSGIFGQTALSNIISVAIPAGSTNSLTVTVNWPSGSYGGLLFAAWTDETKGFFFNSGLGTGVPTSGNIAYTVTSITQIYYGPPDPEFDHFKITVSREFVSGVFNQKLATNPTHVDSTHGILNFGFVSGLVAHDANFIGRIISKMANYLGSTASDPSSLPSGVGIIDFKVTDTDASGNFTVTPDPSISSYGVQAGDVFTMRTSLSSITATSFTDVKFTNPYNPQGLVKHGNAGNFVLVIGGTGAGQPPVLVADNTGPTDSPANTIYITTPFAIALDGTSIIVLVEQAPQVSLPQPAIQLASYAGFSGLLGLVPVPNYVGQVVRIEIYTVNSQGTSGPQATVSWREMYLWGAQGTYPLGAASSNMLPQHKTIPYNTSAAATGVTGGVTTLGAAISSPITTPTNITLAGAIPSGINGVYIKIDSEWLFINSGGSTTTVQVTGGQMGTTAATHSNGATVTYGGQVVYQLQPIAAVPDREMIIQKLTSITNTSTGAGDLNYLTVKCDGSNTFLDGSTQKVLPDNTPTLGLLHLKGPSGLTTWLQLAGGGSVSIGSGGGGGGNMAYEHTLAAALNLTAAAPAWTAGATLVTRLVMGSTPYAVTAGAAFKFNGALVPQLPNTQSTMVWYGASSGLWELASPPILGAGV